MKMYFKETDLTNDEVKNFHCLHHNDADGYSSAALVAGALDNWDESRFTKQTYSDFKKDFNKDTVVFIVDLSISASTYDSLVEIINNSKAVIWIDHHQTSIETFEKNREFLESHLNGYLLSDNGYSGCYLTYLYCYEMQRLRYSDDSLIVKTSNGDIDLSDVDTAFNTLNVPFFIKLISDYDTWSQRYKGDQNHFNAGLMDQTENFNSSKLRALSENIRYNNHEIGYIPNLIDSIIEHGRIINDYNTKNNAKKLKLYGYTIKIRIRALADIPIKCLVMNERGNSFLFGDNLYKTEIDFGVSVVFDGREWIYSIFKNPHSPCPITSKDIAEFFNGGGHPGAAGFRFPRLLFSSTEWKCRFVEIVYDGAERYEIYHAENMINIKKLNY